MYTIKYVGEDPPIFHYGINERCEKKRKKNMTKRKRRREKLRARECAYCAVCTHGADVNIVLVYSGWENIREVFLVK